MLLDDIFHGVFVLSWNTFCFVVFPVAMIFLWLIIPTILLAHYIIFKPFTFVNPFCLKWDCNILRYTTGEFNQGMNKDSTATTLPPLFLSRITFCLLDGALKAALFAFMSEEDDFIRMQSRLGQLLDTLVGAWAGRWNHWGFQAAIELHCSSSVTNALFNLLQADLGYMRRIHDRMHWMCTRTNLYSCI